MKRTLYLLAALSTLALAQGCVRRTVSTRPGYKNPNTGKLYTVNASDIRTVEERTVWFWQKGFLNPEKH